MHTIDGSEGGGQLLRTALTMSVLTDTPFRIESIRGSRPEPGLRPQHLAAVELVADLCDATVEGADLDAEALTFTPGSTWRSSLDASIPTAGSATLLLDTVLPIAAVADEPFAVTVTGGTDVTWSPTVAYLRRVKLGLLSTVGLDAEVDVARTGFYPAGGGAVTLRTRPSSLSSLDLVRRGRLEVVEIYSKASADLEERSVADRQAARAADALAEADLPAETASVAYVDTRSPGSSLLLAGVYDGTVAGVDELGAPGRTSEAVAEAAVERFRTFHDGPGAVDPHMADQLAVFLALVGGRVWIPAVTDHVRTNCELLSSFGSDLSVERENGRVTLTASSHPDIGY